MQPEAAKRVGKQICFSIITTKPIKLTIKQLRIELTKTVRLLDRFQLTKIVKSLIKFHD